MFRLFRRMRGGLITVISVLAVLAIDWIALPRIPALRAFGEIGDPSDHVGDLIAASGVAVAFVLTYLAALTGLPSPGRQLLTSALRHIRFHHPDLAAIDEDGRISQDEFRKLGSFVDDARDLALHDEDAQAASELFRLVVNLAKSPHIRPTPTVVQLEILGYSHFRAVFLNSIVFPRDTEKRLLLRATILCAIFFSYASLIYCFQLLGWLNQSLIMLIGYPLLALIGAAFATAMSLRMWPHEIEESAIGAIVGPIGRAMERDVQLAMGELDLVVRDAIEAMKTHPDGIQTCPMCGSPLPA